MTKKRLITIVLDGYEHSLQQQMIASGELPNLAGLARRSARYILDHGRARLTGLSGEHVASGLDPDRAGRQASVHFDAATYGVCQAGSLFEPFVGRLACRTVSFDVPYLDLARAPNVRGIGNWGAHDPGVPLSFQPESLRHAFINEIGPYPAKPWIYGLAWSSAEHSRRMGEDLCRAVDLRSRAVRWTLRHMSDWEFAFIGVSEAHSAIEALWHGIDPNHPLHAHSSAPAAGEALRNLYRAIDRMVGAVLSDWPDAQVALFAPHGMGSNDSDIATMVLLPEVLHRHHFGRPLMRAPARWAHADTRPGHLGGHIGTWTREINRAFPRANPRLWRMQLAQRVPATWKWRFDRATLGGAVPRGASTAGPIDWMPSTQYQPWWPAMRAFVLPSYYDGRIRVNLAGREARGVVGLDEYTQALDEITALLHDCRDADSGEPVVAALHRPHHRDPLQAGPTDADLIILWRGPIRTLRHPAHGRIGPIPYRRTGGHSSPLGFAWLANTPLAIGEHGMRSAFDMAPTLVDLLGESSAGAMSGTSLLRTASENMPDSSTLSEVAAGA